jgi:hypothetical protein
MNFRLNRSARIAPLPQDEETNDATDTSQEALDPNAGGKRVHWGQDETRRMTKNYEAWKPRDYHRFPPCADIMKGAMHSGVAGSPKNQITTTRPAENGVAGSPKNQITTTRPAENGVAGSPKNRVRNTRSAENGALPSNEHSQTTTAKRSGLSSWWRGKGDAGNQATAVGDGARQLKPRRGKKKWSIAKKLGATVGAIILLTGVCYGLWKLAEMAGTAFLESELATQIKENTNLLDGIASKEEEQSLIRTQTARLQRLIGGLEEQNRIFENGVNELLDVNMQLKLELDRFEGITVRLEARVMNVRSILDGQEEELQVWNQTLMESEEAHERIRAMADEKWTRLQFVRRRTIAWRREVEFFEDVADAVVERNNEWDEFVGVLNATAIRKWEAVELQNEANEHAQQNNNNLTLVIADLNGTIDSWLDLIDIREVQLHEYENTTAQIEDTIDTLEEQNTELAANNEKLAESVDYFESLVEMYGDAFGDYLSSRASIMQADKDMVYFTLDTYFLRRISDYEASLRDHFDANWVWDDRRRMQPDYYDAIAFVDRELFSHMCIDVTDFEPFTFAYFPDKTPETIIAREFFFTVGRYAFAMTNYLFPPSVDSYTGPRRTQLEWEEFGYDCENFDPPVNFTWVGNIKLND